MAIAPVPFASENGAALHDDKLPMTALVLCPCRHAIDVHDPGGCRGDRVSRCGCARTPIEAMEAAVDGARSSYVREHAGSLERDA